MNYVDESSAAQLQIGKEEAGFGAFSYMQSLTPHLILGGRYCLLFIGLLDSDPECLRYLMVMLFSCAYARRTRKIQL